VQVIFAIFMRTPMQMKYATKVAYRRRASRGIKLPCSII